MIYHGIFTILILEHHTHHFVFFMNYTGKNITLIHILQKCASKGSIDNTCVVNSFQDQYVLSIKYVILIVSTHYSYNCYEKISRLGCRPFKLWHYDVIKWKHFPRCWPCVLGIHRPPVNAPHKSQWRRALMFSFICAWINGWVNNGEAGDLIRHGAHYDVTVIKKLVID